MLSWGRALSQASDVPEIDVGRLDISTECTGEQNFLFSR